MTDTKKRWMLIYRESDDIQDEYHKYVEYCKSLGKEPRMWTAWYYCTYSAFEESWRLSH